MTMLTLTNPTIDYSFVNSISGKREYNNVWFFIKDMMGCVFDLSKNHESMWHNSADGKAFAFYRLAEFANKCYANGVDGIRIVQDDTLYDNIKTQRTYWGMTCDEATSTVKVSKGFMRVLINSDKA
jgi:hypothetical protein